MLSTIIKVVILVVIVLFIAWVGTCVYSNFIAKPDTGQLHVPDKDKAAYSVIIQNTRNLLLTNDYEQQGQDVGSRVFILHGFWELQGKEYNYKDTDVLLDEYIFGEIIIRRRE